MGPILIEAQHLKWDYSIVNFSFRYKDNANVHEYIYDENEHLFRYQSKNIFSTCCFYQHHSKSYSQHDNFLFAHNMPNFRYFTHGKFEEFFYIRDWSRLAQRMLLHTIFPPKTKQIYIRFIKHTVRAHTFARIELSISTEHVAVV